MKAQTAFEFMAIVGFIMLFFSAAFLVINNKIVQYESYKKAVKTGELANLVMEEILLASKMEGTYAHTFTIPKKLNNQNYTITIFQNELVIAYLGDEFVYYLPIEVENSTIAPGKNVITKYVIE